MLVVRVSHLKLKRTQIGILGYNLVTSKLR